MPASEQHASTLSPVVARLHDADIWEAGPVFEAEVPIKELKQV